MPSEANETIFGGTVTCWFRDASGEKLAGVAIVAADAKDAPADVYAAAAAASDAARINGMGDSAVWSADVLYVAVGDELLTVQILPLAGVDPGQLQTLTASIASVALGRYATLG